MDFLVWVGAGIWGSGEADSCPDSVSSDPGEQQGFQLELLRTLGDAGCHCMYLNVSVEKSLFRSPTRSNKCRPQMRGNPVGGRRQFY